MCKFKAHKRCAVRATNNCKWTTLASIGKDIIEDEDGVSLGLILIDIDIIDNFFFFKLFSGHQFKHIWDTRLKRL